MGEHNPEMDCFVPVRVYTVSMWHRDGEYIAYGNLPKFKPQAV